MLVTPNINKAEILVFGTKNICPICSASFSSKKNVRPNIYCSSSCAEIEKFFSALENRILKKINNKSFFNFSSNSLKSRLFRLSNLLICSKKEKI